MDYMVITEEITLLIEQQTHSMSANIIDQLISRRKELHLTQQDVANATGMKRANVTRIESKKYTPTLEVLNRYADCMGMKLNMTLEKKEDRGERA
jgi:transcriptional regulator with XRE-family HTH domain